MPALGVTLTLKGSCNSAAFKTLGILFTVTAVFYLNPFRESINYRGANTVQTACDLISLAAELTACVKNCVYNLKRGKPKLLIHTRGDTSTVVLYRHAVVRPENNFY